MQEATRLQPETLNWAAGSKLSKGEISQEDYKKVIQGEMELEEAVRRVMDGEVESAIAVQRRKAEKQAAERRAALKETRENMTDSATIEAQENQVQELTVEPVEEDQAYEETAEVEEVEIEEPKWDVVLVQDDGTLDILEELGGKLADAKKRGQELYDGFDGSREVRVRAYADEKTKKTYKVKRNQAPAPAEPATKETTKNQEAAEQVLVEAQATAAAPAPLGTGTRPDDPDTLPKWVTIGRNGTASVYVSSRTTITGWQRLAAKDGGLVKADDRLVNVVEILDRKLQNIKVYDRQELEALITSSGQLGQQVVDGKLEASKTFGKALVRLSEEKFAPLRPYFA